MLRRLLTTSCLIFTTLFGQVTFAAKEIGIPEVVPFAEDLRIREAVRNECELGEKVASFLKKYSKKTYFSDDPNNGQYVNMSITEVHASGGGAWSGPKWMEVTGELTENGKSVASFRAKRFTTGGAFGGFKGTCSIVGRCAKAIAKDISVWLKDPRDGAELGDAQ